MPRLLRRAPRLLGAAGALTALALAVTACSSGSQPAAPSSGQAADGAFPVTVAHAFGTTEIAAAPTRIATVGWGSEDVAVALGQVPVNMPKALFGDDNGDGYLPWTYDAVTKAGAQLPELHDETDGIPYEAISAATPDLILGTNSGLDEQQYTTLGKIAPTVAYPGTPWGTGWRDSTRLVGQSLGKPAEAEQLIADTEAKMAETMKAYPAVAGKTVMVMWVDAKDPAKISYYTPNDTRVRYLQDLGFTLAPNIVTLSQGNDQFVGEIGAEQADQLNADVAVIYVSGGDLSTLQNDPLLSRIPAVARGSVVMLDNETETMAVSAPTVLSIPWALPGYAQRLGEAAAKVG